MADISKLRFDGTDYNVKDASAPARPLGNGYSKTGTLPISSTDTISEAIGKLENTIGSGGGGAVDSVSVGGGTPYTPDANGNIDLPAYPTTLPASDVYSWAKASSKPSYTYAEVGAASVSHSHTLSMASSSSTSSIDLEANTKYQITAGGSSYVFKTPPSGSSSAVTGVKGSNESTYRTGNVSLSYSNVGAAASSHSHSDYVKQAYYTSNKTSGSLNDLSEGRVYCHSNCTNLPVSANCMVETLVDYYGSYKTQRAEVISGVYKGSSWLRVYESGSWSSWVMTGSPVWSMKSKTYSASSADTWEYSGLSFTFDISNDVVYEYIVVVKCGSGTGGASFPAGVAVTDTASNITSATSRCIHVEDSHTINMGTAKPWMRVVNGTTSWYASGTPGSRTLYVQVKLTSTQNHDIRVYYRPMQFNTV